MTNYAGKIVLASRVSEKMRLEEGTRNYTYVKGEEILSEIEEARATTEERQKKIDEAIEKLNAKGKEVYLARVIQRDDHKGVKAPSYELDPQTREIKIHLGVQDVRGPEDSVRKVFSNMLRKFAKETNQTVENITWVFESKKPVHRFVKTVNIN